MKVTRTTAQPVDKVKHSGGASEEVKQAPGEVEAVFAPVASTSKIPYRPPRATLLPPELVYAIIQLARPSLPPVSNKLVPRSAALTAFNRLPLLCHFSPWSAVANAEIARSVVLRSERQVKQLVEALESGKIGGDVEEILFEIKERGSDEDEELKRAFDDLPADVRCDAVVDLIKACAPTLKALRLRGFGESAVAHLATFRFLLPKLEVFEYSPIDNSYFPSTADLVSLLPSLPSLRNLTLAPSSRQLIPLLDPPEAYRPNVTRLLDALLRISLHPTGAGALSDVLADLRLTHLTSLTLKSVAINPSAFLGLVFSSLGSLTALHLSSIAFVGGPADVYAVLSVSTSRLTAFTAEDRLVNHVPPGAPAAFQHLTHSLLPSSLYWELLSRLKQVKTLKLFSQHLFDVLSATRVGFKLPPDLEELSIGCRGDVEVDELGWWLDKVEELLNAGEPKREEEDEKEGEEDAETVTGEDFAVGEKEEEEKAEGADEHKSDEGAQADKEGRSDGVDDDDNPSPPEHRSPRIARSDSSSTHASEDGSPPPAPLDPPHPPPGDRPPPASRPPRPSLPSSPSSAFSTPPLPCPPSSPPRPSRRRPTWRLPPASSPTAPAPKFHRLTLTTATDFSSALRDDPAIQSRPDALVDRGVTVAWYSLVVVVLETLELTRELRVEMGRVPPGWGG
ncbi:hypothetical protein JCM8097_008009 [Rhodosporidiobolus ruineniae]